MNPKQELALTKPLYSEHQSLCIFGSNPKAKGFDKQLFETPGSSIKVVRCDLLAESASKSWDLVDEVDLSAVSGDRLSLYNTVLIDYKACPRFGVVSAGEVNPTLRGPRVLRSGCRNYARRKADIQSQCIDSIKPPTDYAEQQQNEVCEWR